MTSPYSWVKQSKQEQWHSKEWNQLQSPAYKELREFYEFFTTTTKSLAVELPAFGYHTGFIPSVMKNWVEQVKTAKDVNLLQSLKDRVGINSMNSNVNETTGELGGSIPLYFIVNNKEDKSYDLGKVLQLFSEMAHNHINMSNIESGAIAGLDLLREQKAYERSSFSALGYKKHPLTTNPIQSLDANKDFIDMYQGMMNDYIYGISTENPSTITKGLDGLNSFTAKTMLGFSIFPALAAVTANIANTQIQIGRNTFFTNKEYGKALWMMATEHAGTDNLAKLKGIKELFDTLIDPRDDLKNRKLSTSIVTRNINSDALFALLRKPDEFNQNAVLLAMLQSSTFDKDGKIVLISKLKKDLRPDNYYQLPQGGKERADIDAKIKEDTKNIKSVMDLIVVKDGVFSIDGHPTLDKEVILAFRQMVKQVNKKIIGNVDNNDKYLYKRNAWFRTLMLFRNWMPAAIAERFGKLDYNRELDMLEMGRYTTMGNFLKLNLQNLFGGVKKDVDNIKWGMMIGVENAAKLAYLRQVNLRPDLADKMSEMEFIDMYKENMQAQYRGIAITFALALAVFFSGRMMGDDDELTPGEKTTAKIIKRAYTEMAMFVNPLEAINMLKSPTASLSPLIAATRALKETAESIGGDKKATPMKNWLNLVPGVSGIDRFWRNVDSNWDDWVSDSKNQSEE
jgi:hypothetical protein